MDVAVIGLRAHSEPIKEASRDLDKMTASSKRAEAANDQRAQSDYAAAAAAKANAQATAALAASSRAAAFRQRQLAVQSLDVAQSLALGMPPMMVAIQQGGQIAGLYAGQGGIAGAAREAAASVLNFAKANPVAVASVAALGVAIAGMTYEINQTSGVAVSFGNVIQATMNVAARAVADLFSPVVASISPLFSSVWQSVIDTTKTAINGIVGGMVGAYRVIVAEWENLPNALGFVGFEAGRSLMEGLLMNFTVGSKLTAPIRNFIADQFGVSTGTVFDVANPFEGKMKSGGANAFQEAIGVDYAGQFFSEVRAEAISLAKVTGEDVSSAAGKAGSALKAAADNGKDAWAGLRDVTTDTLDKMREASNQLGSQVGGIFRGLIDKTMDWKDAALSALNSVLQYMNQMNLARGGSGLFGGGFLQSLIGGVLGISGFANGGMHSGGYRIVGERGPELEATGPARYYSASQTQRMLSGANANARQPANQNAKIEVVLSPDLEARILAAAQNQSVQIVRQAAPGIVKQSVAATGQTLATKPGFGS